MELYHAAQMNMTRMESEINCLINEASKCLQTRLYGLHHKKKAFAKLKCLEQAADLCKLT